MSQEYADEIEENMPEMAHDLNGSNYQLDEPESSYGLEAESEILEDGQEHGFVGKTTSELLEQCYSPETGEWELDYIERITDKVSRKKAIEMFESQYGEDKDALRTFSTAFEDMSASNPLVPESMRKTAT